VSFERGHLGQDVVFNPANDSLTIYKVPPNLKAQLIALIEKEQAEQQTQSGSPHENGIGAQTDQTNEAPSAF